LPSKRKNNYVPLILAASCQWLVDWRRHGRPPSRHRRRCFVASLTGDSSDDVVSEPNHAPGSPHHDENLLHGRSAYSKALRSDISVKLVVDRPAEPARDCENTFAVTVGGESKRKRKNRKLL
jgi:hypothetical protein